MKTSVIDVHAMLSILSIDEVEKRISEVPGVESVTVNYAARSATTRYDETRLEASDIKSAVRQRGIESETHNTASADDADDSHVATGTGVAVANPENAIQKSSQSGTAATAAPAAVDASESGHAHIDENRVAMSSDMAKVMGHGGNNFHSKSTIYPAFWGHETAQTLL